MKRIILLTILSLVSIFAMGQDECVTVNPNTFPDCTVDLNTVLYSDECQLDVGDIVNLFTGGTTVTNNGDGTITINDGTTSATVCESPCSTIVDNGDGTTTISVDGDDYIFYNTDTDLVEIADNGDGTGSITDGDITLDVCLSPCPSAVDNGDGTVTVNIGGNDYNIYNTDTELVEIVDNTDGTINITLDGSTYTVCTSPCGDGSGGTTETTWAGTSSDGTVTITAGGTSGHAPDFAVNSSVVLNEIITNPVDMTALCAAITANCGISSGETNWAGVSTDGALTITPNGTAGHAPFFAVDADALAQILIDDTDALNILIAGIDTDTQLTNAEVCAAVASSCPPSGGGTTTVIDNGDGTGTIGNGTTTLAVCLAPCSSGTTTTVTNNGDGTVTINDGTTSAILCEAPCADTYLDNLTHTLVGSIYTTQFIDQDGNVIDTQGYQAGDGIVFTNTFSPTGDILTISSSVDVTDNNDGTASITDGTETVTVCLDPCGGGGATITDNNDGTGTITDGTTTMTFCEAPCGVEVTENATAPTDPEVGDVWINTTVNPAVYYVFNGISFVPNQDRAFAPRCDNGVSFMEMIVTGNPSGIYVELDGITAYTPTGAVTDGYCNPNQCVAYAVSSANLDAFVWATGGGVTLTEHGSGEMRFNIPDGVRIKKANVDFPLSFTNLNAIYVQFAYAETLGYNTSAIDADAPLMRIDNLGAVATGRSLANFSDGAATAQENNYGISNVGNIGAGGTTDIEMVINDATAGLNTFLTIDFSTFLQ